MDRSEILSRWTEQASECLTFEVVWFAGVGLEDHDPPAEALTVAGAFAEIKGPVRYDAAAAAVLSEVIFVDTGYEVDDFQWEECTARITNGTAAVGLGLNVTLDNPPSLREVEITEFVVAVDGYQPPVIQCQMVGGEVGPSTDWAGWFYTLPLSLMNADRLLPEPRPRSAWEFVIPITSQTGQMGELDVEESRTESGTTAHVHQSIVVTHIGPEN